MKKIEQRRATYYDGFIALRDAAPLDTPFSIQIDPTNRCNFGCKFCPTAYPDLLASVGRPLSMMSFDLAKKAIDDISDFPRRLRTLQFYKDGEPFLNKAIYDMIAYAKERGVAEMVSTTTNGTLLTDENIGRLLDAGLDHIQISIEHVNDSGYEDITQKKIKYSDVRDKVRALFEEKSRRGHHLYMFVKIVDTGLTEEERQIFYNDFSRWSDGINITALMGWSHSEMKDFRLGQRPSVGPDGFTPLQPRQVCPDPLKNLAVNADGTVSVCCVDWSYKTSVGDVNTEHLVDIWNGERMYQFRRLHLTGRRSEIAPCANCQRMEGGTPPSYVDDVADRILADLDRAREERLSATSAGAREDVGAPS